jgi:hypothetical protein
VRVALEARAAEMRAARAAELESRVELRRVAKVVEAELFRLRRVLSRVSAVVAVLERRRELVRAVLEPRAGG